MVPEHLHGDIKGLVLELVSLRQILHTFPSTCLFASKSFERKALFFCIFLINLILAFSDFLFIEAKLYIGPIPVLSLWPSWI